jgi:hypothetical protein
MSDSPTIRSALEELAQKFRLLGVLVAREDGTVLARVGTFNHSLLKGLRSAPEGGMRWIPETSEQIASLSAWLANRPTLPRIVGQGSASAYLAVPLPGLIAVGASVTPCEIPVTKQWHQASEACRWLSTRLSSALAI